MSETTDLIQAIAGSVSAAATVGAVIQLVYVSRQLKVQQLQFLSDMTSGEMFIEIQTKAYAEVRRVVGRLPAPKLSPDEARIAYEDDECRRSLVALMNIFDLFSAVGLDQGLRQTSSIEHYALNLLGIYTRFHEFIKFSRFKSRAYVWSRLEYLVFSWSDHLLNMPEIGPDNELAREYKLLPKPMKARRFKWWGRATRYLPNPLNWPKSEAQIAPGSDA